MDFSEQLFAKFSGYRIFCGFSGGADSTAALLLARNFRSRFGYDLTAVHFNHHLRGAESDREAAEAELFAKAYGIPFQCIDLAVAPGENLESAARNARLEAWKKILPPEKSAVVLGHHADDRKENVLIRLFRGSNSKGLSSMRELSQVNGITFIRPLLKSSRQEIETFLRSSGVERWAQDSSNASPDYLRNYLRCRFLPELEKIFPGSLKGMERSITALESDADFIDSCVAAIPEEQKRSIKFWRTQHDAVRIRLLRELIKSVPTYDLLERINHELLTDSGELRLIPAGKGITIMLRRDLIAPAPPPSETPPSCLWSWRETPSITSGRWSFQAVFPEKVTLCAPDEAFFDADKLPGTLEIALPEPGERMIPFGSVTEKKIKKLRTDRGITADRKLPVLKSGGTVFWAVMIRHSAQAPVTESTKNIVKFEFRELVPRT